MKRNEANISPGRLFFFLSRHDVLNLLHSLIEDTLLVSSDRRKLHHDIWEDVFLSWSWYFSVYYHRIDEKKRRKYLYKKSHD